MRETVALSVSYIASDADTAENFRNVLTYSFESILAGMRDAFKGRVIIVPEKETDAV